MTPKPDTHIENFYSESKTTISEHTVSLVAIDIEEGERQPLLGHGPAKKSKKSIPKIDPGVVLLFLILVIGSVIGMHLLLEPGE